MLLISLLSSFLYFLFLKLLLLLDFLKLLDSLGYSDLLGLLLKMKA